MIHVCFHQVVGDTLTVVDLKTWNVSATTPCLKKTVPTYVLLLVCQIWTDFNKNCKDCPGRNP